MYQLLQEKCVFIPDQILSIQVLHKTGKILPILLRSNPVHFSFSEAPETLIKLILLSIDVPMPSIETNFIQFLEKLPKKAFA